MSWKPIVMLLTMLMISCAIYAQAPAVRTERILIILDASASMQQPWQDSSTRYKAASAFIMQLMDSVYARNNEVEFSLRVYGHQSPAGLNDCYDTKLEVMYSRDNYTQMGLRLASLRTIGVTPVSFAINEAIDYDMQDAMRYNYHMVIITDGGESCGGNLCVLTGKLTQKHIPLPCIISLASDAVLKEQYSCLGNYQTAVDLLGIATAVHNMLNVCCRIPYLPKPGIINTEVPITTRKPVEGYWQNAKPKQDTTAKTFVIKESKSVNDRQFKPISVIKTSYKIGYLKLINTSAISRITLYYFADGKYNYYADRQISPINTDQRIMLQEGKYRITYGDGLTKEFKIVGNMITDVAL